MGDPAGSEHSPRFSSQRHRDTQAPSPRQAGDIFNDIAKYSTSLDKLGIYYDNPNAVPVEKRRFAVGAIVDEIKDRKLIKQVEKNNYKIFKLPEFDRSVNTTCPFKNILSIFIAVMKVPYRLGDYIQAKKIDAHLFLEIYKRPLIHFVVPLSDFDAYNVPEINNE
ncbi:unnamed protein product [Rotaria magnacalcarata]|uniref:Uncharacterized protein n=2 Tax=Rotaria magnacalcarata TaxID=392030 RepID=A0A816RCP2_9BILA|nr:unnamed protein product [Rotaria magnacalcarata]CAF2072030.1 unnamed protein product [Rotaria magnacalcarata]CAF2163449.1 unnamed protein product [Rotaria magnacalcarata]CAF4341155.1 unnamed protein product [Rotaria magnacalcarata]CAF4454604.1 unnamed protein product [Rotaria magnacalcarata]